MNFFLNVYRVQEIPGITSDKPNIWRIDICHEMIEINTNEILSPRKFTAEYLKKFKCLPPRALKYAKNWDKFVGLLGSLVEPCADEDNEDIFLMDEFLSKVTHFDITSDRRKWVTGNFLLLHEGKLLLPSDKIVEVINDIGVKIDLGILGKMMVERKIKDPGTRHISIQGKKQRAWWFQIDALNVYRDSKINLSKLTSNGGINE